MFNAFEASIWSVWKYTQIHKLKLALINVNNKYKRENLQLNFESSFSLRITTHDIITSARMLECVANASDDVRHDVKFDPKESGERWIQITDDVAQEGDREDGDDTHDEFHPVWLGLQ